MPLIKCPDCGKEVSALATVCPGCGRPVSTISIDDHKAQQTDVLEKSNVKKPTEKEAFKAFIISGALTGGLYYFFPNFPIWVFLFVFMSGAGAIYSEGIKTKANEKILNSK